TGLAAAVLAAVVIYPVATIVFRLFTSDGSPSLSSFEKAMQQPGIFGVVTNTIIVVAVSAFLATVGGTLFAWLNERTDARMGVLTDVLPVVPLLVPPIAGAVGWIILASPRSGYLNVYLRELFSWVGINLTDGPLEIASWYGLIFVYTLYMIPHVYVV